MSWYREIPSQDRHPVAVFANCVLIHPYSTDARGYSRFDLALIALALGNSRQVKRFWLPLRSVLKKISLFTFYLDHWL
jgi:hypothetical protein